MHQGMHHLHLLRKVGRVSSRWKQFFDRFMYVIAVVAPFSYAPQTYKLYAGQDASGLSIWSFIFLFLINILWLFYAWAHRATPLVITSVVFCMFHVLIVTGIVLFS